MLTKYHHFLGIFDLEELRWAISLPSIVRSKLLLSSWFFFGVLCVFLVTKHKVEEDVLFFLGRNLHPTTYREMTRTTYLLLGIDFGLLGGAFKGFSIAIGGKLWYPRLETKGLALRDFTPAGRRNEDNWAAIFTITIQTLTTSPELI